MNSVTISYCTQCKSHLLSLVLLVVFPTEGLYSVILINFGRGITNFKPGSVGSGGNSNIVGS